MWQVLMQVFNDIEPSELDRKKPRSEPGPRLLIWGGKGRHQTIFNDLYELDLIKVGPTCCCCTLASARQRFMLFLLL